MLDVSTVKKERTCYRISLLATARTRYGYYKRITSLTLVLLVLFVDIKYRHIENVLEPGFALGFVGSNTEEIICKKNNSVGF